MYGASYVELERAVGPEGSTRKRVSRFTFCNVVPSVSQEGDGSQRLLWPILTPVFTPVTLTRGKQCHLFDFPMRATYLKELDIGNKAFLLKNNPLKISLSKTQIEKWSWMDWVQRYPFNLIF